MAHRGVIEQDFLFRFWKQVMNYERGAEAEEVKSFACPGKCGRWLLQSHESYEREIGAFFEIGERGMTKLAMRLGACPCGIYICLRCHCSERYAAGHVCAEAKAVDDKASLEMIQQMGKKCPACGMPIQKAEGCDLMMCGTTAHGKVQDALRNGGCAYIFSWNTLQPVHDGHGYTDIGGTWVRMGSPMDKECVDRRVLLPK